MSISKFVLDSGLSVIIEEIPSMQSVSLGYFFKTGNRDEVEGEEGISHFLEHMLFKGTPNHSASQILNQLGMLGVQSNACTSYDFTAYYGTCLQESARGFIELLSDMMCPILDPKEFALEKKVVQEEIAMYADQPASVFFNKVFKNCFNQHPISKPILGTTESVESHTPESMRSYYERRYTQPNAALVIAGNISKSQVMESLGSLEIPLGTDDVSENNFEHQFRADKQTFKRKDLSRANLAITLAGIPANSKQESALTLLFAMIGNGRSSKIYQQLLKTAIADKAHVYNSDFRDTGLINFFATCAEDNLDRVSEIMHQIFESCLDFREEDLLRSKSRLRTQLAISHESTENRMFSLGEDWMYGKKTKSVKQLLEEIESVTLEEVHACYRSLKMDSISEFRMIAE